MRNRKDQIRNLAHGALFGLVVVAVMALLVGCGNKDGRDRFGTAGGYMGVLSGSSCVGCPAGSTLWDAATGFTQDGAAQLALHMYTDRSAVQGGSGQLYGTGQLIVNQPIACPSAYGGGMGIQPGIYTLQTFNMGNYNDNLFGGLTMVAQNGFTQIEIYLDIAYVTEANPKLSVCGNRTGTGPIYNALNSSAFVTNVNGFACNINVSTLVPQGTPLCN